MELIELIELINFMASMILWCTVNIGKSCFAMFVSLNLELVQFVDDVDGSKFTRFAEAAWVLGSGSFSARAPQKVPTGSSWDVHFIVKDMAHTDYSSVQGTRVYLRAEVLVGNCGKLSQIQVSTGKLFKFVDVSARCFMQSICRTRGHEQRQKPEENEWILVCQSSISLINPQVATKSGVIG